MLNELMQINIESWLKTAVVIVLWIIVAGFVASRLFRLSEDEYDNF